MLTYHDISDSLHVLGVPVFIIMSHGIPCEPCDTLWYHVGAMSVSQTIKKLASYSSAKYL